MPYATPLTETEIAEGLSQLPDWRLEGDTIHRTVRCPTFPQAIALVDRVAVEAEAADHHPEILINWKRVTFSLTTHAAHALTTRDLRMAATIDRLAGQLESGPHEGLHEGPE